MVDLVHNLMSSMRASMVRPVGSWKQSSENFLCMKEITKGKSTLVNRDLTSSESIGADSNRGLLA